MQHPDRATMERAIELANKSFKAGDYAVGAVVILDGKIIAEASTTITREQDVTCHAEINAIRQASKVLKSKNLKDCYLYSTYEPCPMCISAAIWAKMKGVVYGANREDETVEHPWRVKISAEDVIKQGTPVLELHPDFMREECKVLLSLGH